MSIDETARVQRRYDRQAAIYDLKEAPWELLAFKRLRRRLWGQVSGGRVLEVGVGTGKNFAHHPAGARVVGIDLSPRMLQRAARRARRLGRHIDLIVADAQQLPFRDGAFDAAAASFVFCSVPDAVAGLEEARRVLRTDGKVHLLEHVRARNPIAGWLMDRLNPIVVRMMGANINRQTVENVRRAGIAVEDVESRAFGIVKLIRGSATRRGSEEPARASRTGRSVRRAIDGKQIGDVGAGLESR